MVYKKKRVDHTKVFGMPTSVMGAANYITLTAAYISVTSRTTLLTVSVNTGLMMATNTSDSGRTMKNMVQVKNSGMTAVITKAASSAIKKKAKVNSPGRTVTGTLALGKAMPAMVKVCLNGMMVEYILENGAIIRCMDRAFSCSSKTISSEVITSVISKMAKAFTFGPMVPHIVVNGKVENNMEADTILSQTAANITTLISKALGIKVNDKKNWMKI